MDSCFSKDVNVVLLESKRERGRVPVPLGKKNRLKHFFKNSVTDNGSFKVGSSVGEATGGRQIEDYFFHRVGFSAFGANILKTPSSLHVATMDLYSSSYRSPSARDLYIAHVYQQHPLTLRCDFTKTCRNNGSRCCGSRVFSAEPIATGRDLWEN